MPVYLRGFPSQTPSNMGLNYAAEGVRNYTLYFPPALQVWAHSLPVRAPRSLSTISNPAEPHGNRNRGGGRDLGMLLKGGRGISAGMATEVIGGCP